MPCLMKSPFIAEWEGVSDAGEWVIKELRPDDLLVDIAKGMTPEELATQHSAPIDAVEHAISHIPHMMAWRRVIVQKQGNDPEGRQSLPALNPSLFANVEHPIPDSEETEPQE